MIGVCIGILRSRASDGLVLIIYREIINKSSCLKQEGLSLDI